MKKRLAGFFLICLCLTGCAKVTNEYDKIETGVITDKDIIKGWKIDTEMPILKGENRAYVDDLVYVGEQYEKRILFTR